MRTDYQILLVEDDHDIAHVLCYLLRRDGHQVVHADSARQAMQLLQQGLQPQLFIVDLIMPEIDGSALLRWLRQEGGYRQPVLVLTATLEQELDARLQAAGANAIAHKPLDMAAIRRIIAGLMD